MKKKNTKLKLILLDRDGTIIFDKKYHLGRNNNWRKLIKILPGVVDGIKLMNKIPDSHVHMITNQPGIAVKNFKLLTEERARQVSLEVISRLRKRGAVVESAFICPHAAPSYTKKRREYKFDKKLVCNCSCIKPRLGMVFAALQAEGVKRKDVQIYVVGDRLSDIEAGLSAGGYGIFVPFKGESGEREKIKKKHGKNKRVFFVKDMVGAARVVKAHKS